jgi:hypothetical protein
MEIDLALATLAPDVIYTNGEYFDAPTSRKLVPEAHVEEYDRVFSYYGAEGFTPAFAGCNWSVSVISMIP